MTAEVSTPGVEVVEQGPSHQLQERNMVSQLGLASLTLTIIIF